MKWLMVLNYFLVLHKVLGDMECSQKQVNDGVCEYQNVPNIVVFGKVGVGKSRFLNCITTGCDSKTFFSAHSARSVTTKPQRYVGEIFGTNIITRIWDTPGIYAGNENLSDWMTTNSNFGKIDVIIWILSVIERPDMLTSLIYSTLNELINNFSFDRLIIVFQRCNQIEEKIDLEEYAKSSIEIITNFLKDKKSISEIKYLFFGTKSTDFFDSKKFYKEFGQSIKDILKSNLPQMSLINNKESLNNIAKNAIKNVDESINFEMNDKKSKIDDLMKTISRMEDQINQTRKSTDENREVYINKTKELTELISKSQEEVKLMQNRIKDLQMQNNQLAHVRYRRCFSEFSEIYKIENDKIVKVTLNQIKLGDMIITILPSEDENTKFSYKKENVVVLSNNYEPFNENTTIPFIEIRTEGNYSLKLHLYHYLNIETNDKIEQRLAKDVKIGDNIFVINTNLDGVLTNDILSTSLVNIEMKKVINIRLCNADEIGRPINLRTQSLNLLINNIWSSSKFYLDGGNIIHKIIVLAYNLNEKFGQMIYDSSNYFGLNDLMEYFH